MGVGDRGGKRVVVHGREARASAVLPARWSFLRQREAWGVRMGEMERRDGEAGWKTRPPVLDATPEAVGCKECRIC